jgi:hypothetical protein
MGPTTRKFDRRLNARPLYPLLTSTREKCGSALFQFTLSGYGICAGVGAVARRQWTLPTRVSGDCRKWRYLASKSAKSLALEQRISSICRASTSAFTLSASIFDASGCCFSSSSIRALSTANSFDLRVLLDQLNWRQDPLCLHNASPYRSRLREPESWLEVEAVQSVQRKTHRR